MRDDGDGNDDAHKLPVDFECRERLAVEHDVNGHDGVSLSCCQRTSAGPFAVVVKICEFVQ
ncbi:hypothetical protein D3C80_2238170 [compost metagenome]